MSDGWPSYANLSELGYDHRVIIRHPRVGALHVRAFGRGLRGRGGAGRRGGAMRRDIDVEDIPRRGGGGGEERRGGERRRGIRARRGRRGAARRNVGGDRRRALVNRVGDVSTN